MALPLEGPPFSARARVREAVLAHQALVEAGALSLAVMIFLVSVLPSLANHPTLTDDEAWVMSASYKLAQEGVFGTDMFRGFYNAEKHYFFNMPGHHFAVAAAFKILGPGVVQARLLGVAYGLATIGLTYLLARRLYGAGAAMLALGLLLFLRLNMGFDTGLPLQELASNVRYDLAPVPFMLAGMLVLLGRTRSAPATEPGPGGVDSGTRVAPALAPPGSGAYRAVTAGVLFGIATLMQFYGAFMIPVAVAFLAVERAPPAARSRAIGWLLGAAVAVTLPYGVYILAHFDDFRGQAGTVDQRDDVSSPAFYVESLIDEPNRFLRPLAFKEVPRGEDPRLVEPRFLGLGEMAVRRPSAKLGVLVGLPLALAFSGRRAFRGRSRADLMLFLALAGLTAQYALLESLKLYIYWIPLVPLLCIGVAGAGQWLLRPPRGDRLRLALAAATALCLLGVLAEGGAARLSGMRSASGETEYARLGNLIHEVVPGGSRVVGSTSLWFAMRDTDYHSYFMFFYLTSPNAGPYRTTIDGFLAELRPQYLVLTRLAVEELEKHLTPGDLRDFSTFKEQHARMVRRIEGPDARSYGYVEIWEVR